MKNKLILSLAACLLLTCSVADGFGGDEKLYRKARKEARLLSIADQITRYVEYPDFAIHNNLEGVVRLSYYINEQNQFQVVDIQSPNTELRDYVLAQIHGKTVADPGNNHQTLKYLKLNFKLN